MKRTTIWLDKTDRTAIEAIKQHYGVSTNSDAVRLALREMERQIKQQEKDEQE